MHSILKIPMGLLSRVSGVIINLWPAGPDDQLDNPNTDKWVHGDTRRYETRNW